MNLQLPEGATRQFVRGWPVSGKELKTWNDVCTDFLTSDSEWLFSTHNDVVFAPETLLRLLSWDKPLVSALIFMKRVPVVPHIWHAYDNDPQTLAMRIQDTLQWFYNHPQYLTKFGPFVMEPRPNDALTEVSFTSTSCTLIHRSVLEALPAPWFEKDSDYGGGEDRRFMQNARAKGFIPYVDRSCIVGHLQTDIPSGVVDFIQGAQSSTYRDTGEQ